MINVLILDCETEPYKVPDSEDCFSNTQMSVTIATSVEEVILALLHRKIDVLITDLSVPPVNGFDTLKVTRVLQPRSYIVLLTTGLDKEAVKFCLTKGFDSVVHSPITMGRLDKLIDQLAACSDFGAHVAPSKWQSHI